MKDKRFITAAEVAEDFRVSESMGYRIIKKLNTELKDKGYITVSGRVSRRYYMERTYFDLEEDERERTEIDTAKGN